MHVVDQWCLSRRFTKWGIFSGHSSGGGVLLNILRCTREPPTPAPPPRRTIWPRRSILPQQRNPVFVRIWCRLAPTATPAWISVASLPGTRHQESRSLVLSYFSETQYSLQEKTLPLYECVSIIFHIQCLPLEINKQTNKEPGNQEDKSHGSKKEKPSKTETRGQGFQVTESCQAETSNCSIRASIKDKTENLADD